MKKDLSLRGLFFGTGEKKDKIENEEDQA